MIVWSAIQSNKMRVVNAMRFAPERTKSYRPPEVHSAYEDRCANSRIYHTQTEEGDLLLLKHVDPSKTDLIPTEAIWSRAKAHASKVLNLAESWAREIAVGGHVHGQNLDT
jgi:hypothetical protein